MSAINGDKARYQKDRKRKLVQRQRTRALVARAKHEQGAAPAKVTTPAREQR